VLLQDDIELIDWVLGITSERSGAGDFLRAIAEAATRADWENYPILRPVLLELQKKYPYYSEADRRRTQEEK